MAQSLKKKREIFRIADRTLKRLYPKPRMALNFLSPFQLLVAVILSAQTTDKKVNQITKELFKKYRTIDDYAKASLRELEEDIRGVNYYKKKARAILENARIIKERYKGEVPKSIEQLIKLRFVGRKTANALLYGAFGITDGIVVDTHVARFSRMLGLTESKDPAKIEKDLMQILPKREWFGFSHRLIDYGREYCPARKHNCGEHPQIV